MDILIVDDEAMLVQSIQIGLQYLGYGVITANSGEGAMRCLYDKGGKVDLVITDYLMPGMNGMEFLQMLRGVYPDLPVLFMSAYADTKLVIEALRSRCDGFLEKPFSLQQLIGEIEIIKRRSPNPRPPSPI